jgi:hypothetical protein
MRIDLPLQGLDLFLQSPQDRYGGAGAGRVGRGDDLGLAQMLSAQHGTERYAAEIFRHSFYMQLPDEVARAAELRRTRQVRLVGPDPIYLDVVINEGALRRVVGDREVMCAQLTRLIEATEVPTVALRVLPFAAGAHPGVDGSFTVLEFADPSNPRIVYLDRMTNSEYLDGLRDVAAYRHAHDQLRASALSVSDSRQMISSLLRELRR